MKHVLARACTLATLAGLPAANPAHAQPADSTTPPTISPADSWVPRQSGTIRVLNKLDSTLQMLTLRVGETTPLQALSVTLQACAVRPPDLPRDAAAHLVVVADGAGGAPAFDGWILQNEPAANVFEHPVYDIQLAACL